MEKLYHVSANISAELAEKLAAAMRKAGFKNKSEFFRVALKEKSSRVLGERA